MTFRDFIRAADGRTFKIFAESCKDVDLSRLMDAVNEQGMDYFSWNKPEQNFRFLAIGRRQDIYADGKERADLCDRMTRPLLTDLYTNAGELLPDPPPAILGGMTFSYGQSNHLWENFHDADWFIPRWLILDTNGTQVLLSYFLDENDEDMIRLRDEGLAVLKLESSALPELPRIESPELEPYDAWAAKVDQLLDQIRAAEVSKVVLSRYVRYSLSDHPSPAVLTDRLAAKFSGCYIFALKKGDSLFFGASPEKLATLHGGRIEADALAGSIPRGKDPEQDEVLGNELLSSEKNLAEQQAVVDFIAHSFEGFTCDLDYSERPVLRKLPNIQHLWTPISGQLCEGSSVLQILKQIHPTPAICGVPWKRARKRIIAIEGYKRGLYTGLLGWFGPGREGDFAVSIRSALVRDKTLWAFAGCGIVRGSDPEGEYRESELKLQPIISLFG